MAKQSKDAKHQKVAKAAIRATRKTTIKKPAKPSRKEHIKQSTISAVWVTVGILVCILVVVFGIFTIDWLVFKHSCDKSATSPDPVESSLIGPTKEQAQGCERHSIFFLENHN